MKAVAFINNAISALLFRRLIEVDQVPLKDVCLIQGRQINSPWMSECGINLPYPARASLKLAGQVKFLSFYRQARKLVDQQLADPELREVYIVNNDNLITSHLLAMLASKPQIRCTVVAEGLMNYQDIQIKNRASWRSKAKQVAAALLGYRWRLPEGHLSGAFEPRVNRVVSFCKTGLIAPLDKVVELPFTLNQGVARTDSDTALFFECALWQWMSPEDFAEFAKRFGKWIQSLGFKRVLIKPHPNYPASELQRSLMGPFEILQERQSAEELAASIQAGTIIGTCTTALFTLKMMRPDLRCMDFGADWYVPKAYHGDDSVVKTLSAVGVEIVQSEPFAA